MTHPHVRHDSSIRVRHDSFIRVRHDSSIATYLSPLALAPAASLWGTWLIHPWDVTHSLVRCDSFTCETWLIRLHESGSSRSSSSRLSMRWLRWVGTKKLKVSFAKEPYKRDDILQKRPLILRSLLIEVTPYKRHVTVIFSVICETWLIHACETWLKDLHESESSRLSSGHLAVNAVTPSFETWLIHTCETWHIRHDSFIHMRHDANICVNPNPVARSPAERWGARVEYHFQEI